MSFLIVANALILGLQALDLPAGQRVHRGVRPGPMKQVMLMTCDSAKGRAVRTEQVPSEFRVFKLFYIIPFGFATIKSGVQKFTMFCKDRLFKITVDKPS